MSAYINPIQARMHNYHFKPTFSFISLHSAYAEAKGKRTIETPSFRNNWESKLKSSISFDRTHSPGFADSDYFLFYFDSVRTYQTVKCLIEEIWQFIIHFRNIWAVNNFNFVTLMNWWRDQVLLLVTLILMVLIC